MRAFLPLLVVAVIGSGCIDSPPPGASQAAGTLEVHAVAGPVCPVETVPPDPDCAPRPVEGAEVFVSPGDGRDIVVASGTTASDGLVRLLLPPGDYLVAAGEVRGLFGHPQPVPVTIAADAPASVTLEYDTGIR